MKITRAMWLELIIIGLVILGLSLLMYRSAIHEFQINQKDFSDSGETNWSALLSEKIPLVIRNVPDNLVENWSLKKTGGRNWPVLLNQKGSNVRTFWSNWVNTPINKESIDKIHKKYKNGERLAQSANLDELVNEWKYNGISRYVYLPGVYKTTGVVLPPIEDVCSVLTQVKCDNLLLVCSDGCAMNVWLAHEGSIPSGVEKQMIGKNPWTLTSETVPWIVDVKYIEIKMKPKQAIIIPSHWYYAVKPDLPIVASEPVIGNGCWYYTSEFHTPISFALNKIV
jgi:hypothetical protein